MKRREFIKISAAAGAATVLPSCVTTSGSKLPRKVKPRYVSPNSKLNVAMIGAGNIARMAMGPCNHENIVAMADVDSRMFGQYAEEFPQIEKARTFTDFRRMLDKMGKDIDAVCINTPDHTHFAATMHAMEMGLHVCTQKPLTHNIWQARTLKKAKDYYGVTTNMAVQGHTYDGIRQMREWYEADVFGQVREVHSWREGPNWEAEYPGKWGYFHKPTSFPLSVDPIPEELNWDLWLGPNRGDTPFNKLYHPKSWRGFHAFGNGQFGDWFPHVADGPVWILDLYEPVVVELEKKVGGNQWIAPDGNVVRWEFKARGNKAPCKFYWYNGTPDIFPDLPKEWTWPGKKPNAGTLYYGDKQIGYTDARSRGTKLVNMDDMRDFRKSGYPDEKYPRVKGGPFAEWIRAIKGEGPEPGANFDFAAPFTEVMMLGVMAAKFGGRIEWDPKKGVTNRPKLNAYLKESVRKGWEYGEYL